MGVIGVVWDFVSNVLVDWLAGLFVSAGLAPGMAQLAAQGLVSLAALLLSLLLARETIRFFQSLRVPRGDGKTVLVLIADLEGDSGARTRDLVRNLNAALQSPEGGIGCRVVQYPRVLRMREWGNATDNQLRAETRARGWLDAKNADLLIWGRFERASGGASAQFSLHFTTRTGVGRREVAFAHAIRFPAEFRTELAAALVVLILRETSAIGEREGHFIEPELELAIERLRPLAESPPAALDSNGRGLLCISLGLALTGLGLMRQGKDGEALLAQAVSVFREALRMYAHELLPLDWAAVQYSLGTALAALGFWRDDETLMEQAIACYKEALTKCTRERAPLNWAAIQCGLSMALTDLGELNGDETTVEQAIAALQEALKECTRQRVPLYWAAIKMRLGDAFCALGDLRADEEPLKQAITSYQEALSECSRERAPMFWSMIHYALGLALCDLADMVEGEAAEELIERAIAAYRNSLKEFTQERVPLMWAAIENSLGNALSDLGEMRGDGEGERLIELAIVAYREALKELTREREPLEWASTQSNLADALSSLGVMRGSPKGEALLELAIDLYRQALTERTRDRVPLSWATTQNNLGVALADLGEMRGGTEGEALIEEAISTYREALKERTRDRVPLSWATTQNNLGISLLDLGEMRRDGRLVREGIACLEAALTMYETLGASANATRTRRTLDQALEVLAKIELGGATKATSMSQALALRGRPLIQREDRPRGSARRAFRVTPRNNAPRPFAPRLPAHLAPHLWR